MKTVEFKFPRSCDPTRASHAIERVCATHGLEIAMKGSLAAYPGSTHWHYKQPEQSGTLEITLDPAAHRLWASVQSGRRAPWINAELPLLRRAIESALRKRGTKPRVRRATSPASHIRC